MNPSDKPNSSDQQQGKRPQNAGGDNSETPKKGTENVSPPTVQTVGTNVSAGGSSGGRNVVRPQATASGASGGGGAGGKSGGRNVPPQGTKGDASGGGHVKPQGTKGGASGGGGGEENIKPQATKGGTSGGGHVKPQGTEGGASGGGENVKPQATKGCASGGGSGGGDGPGSSEVSKRKIGRSDDPGASSSGEQKPKRIAELNVPTNCDPSCTLCGKKYSSWKSVFGHLRAHPKEWKGAYPPPAFNTEGSPERLPSAPLTDIPEGGILMDQLVPTLLTIAHNNLTNMGGGAVLVEAGAPRLIASVASTGASASSSSSTPLRRGGDVLIDLNQTQEGAGPSSSTKTRLFDLNMPPPPEEDDDENDTAA